MTVDTAPLIYFLSKQEPWWPLVRNGLVGAASRDQTIVVSTVTELELRVGPLRAVGPAGVNSIDRLLQIKGFEVVDVSRDVAREGAALRAEYGLELPDAVVAATATVAGCSALLGNDERFRIIDAPWTYLHVDDFVPD